VYEEHSYRTLQCMAAPIGFWAGPYGVRHPLWKEAEEPYIGIKLLWDPLCNFLFVHIRFIPYPKTHTELCKCPKWPDRAVVGKRWILYCPILRVNPLPLGKYLDLSRFLPYITCRPDNYREQKKRKAICV